MGSFKKFEDIKAWQKARVLVKEIFQLIRNNHKIQKEFSLKNQIVRSSISIMSNIAEGFSKKTDKEFSQFLHISKGSSSELKSLFYVLIDSTLVTQNTFDNFYDKISEIEKLLSGLISYLVK